MKEAWAISGRVVARLLRPFIGYYIRDSERSRILVRHQGSVLLVQDWLGSQQWSLPGGGIHSNETPEEAAIRELYEETKVRIAVESVQFHTLRDVVTQHNRQPYRAALCSAQLEMRQKPQIRRPELLDARWFQLDDLPKKRDPLIDDIIALID